MDSNFNNNPERNNNLIYEIKPTTTVGPGQVYNSGSNQKYNQNYISLENLIGNKNINFRVNSPAENLHNEYNLKISNSQ